MTAEQWLEKYSQSLGISPPDQRERDLLLKVAAQAAHSSERLAAPLACWMIGRSNLSLEVALELAEVLTAES